MAEGTAELFNELSFHLLSYLEEQAGVSELAFENRTGCTPEDVFAWGDDGVQLLATPFTDRLDERLFASLKFCNSVPAFLANVQLDLFEKQTLCPG